jgi:uncharacterized SAM-binding protein YcdF (DUF218 family)
MAEHSVVLFHSTVHAIRAEKVLTRAGIKIKLIPTPRQLSSDCGMALRFDRLEAERVSATLAESKVPTNGIHAL